MMSDLLSSFPSSPSVANFSQILLCLGLWPTRFICINIFSKFLKSLLWLYFYNLGLFAVGYFYCTIGWATSAFQDLATLPSSFSPSLRSIRYSRQKTKTNLVSWWQQTNNRIHCSIQHHLASNIRLSLTPSRQINLTWGGGEGEWGMATTWLQSLLKQTLGEGREKQVFFFLAIEI